MIFKNISRWKVCEELEGLLFFAQRLNELLFDYTLDSYKPPALNSPFLAQEAVNLISEIESGVIDIANLDPVLEELEWSIQNDNISKKLLDATTAYYITRGENVKLSETKLKLEVLAKTLEPYRYLLESVEVLFFEISKKSKKSIDALSKNVITTLVNIGISKQHLFEVTNDFFFSQEGNPIDSLDCFHEFIEIIMPVSHHFDLYFISSSIISEISDSISSLEAEVLDELPDELIETAKSNGFIKNAGEVYVHIDDIRAYDKYSARDEAIRTLENLGNLFTIFHHKSRVTWRPQALASQCCNPGFVMVTAPKSAMDKVADMRAGKASKELNRLINTLPLNNNSYKRLMRVADLHGICISHAISENQLVNIWTALETLIPSNLGSSKISNITSSMQPFLMKAYTGRIIERFTYDLLRWDQWRAKKILRKVPSNPGSSLAIRAKNLLSVKGNNGLRDDLYLALKDFHLLRHRAFQLSSTFSDPKKVKEMLQTHEKKINWQLRRIYRTRNLIVHTGRYPNYLPTLIENGHEYLDQIIFDLIKMTCGEYRTESLEQAFEIAKILNVKFNRKIDAINEFTHENSDFLIDTGPKFLL